jgi:hypothetical protein
METNVAECQPDDPDNKYAKLEEWRQALLAAADAKAIIETEQRLRKEVTALFFPEPKEGTNNFDLGSDWKLKAVYKIDRKVDEAALPSVLDELHKLKVVTDNLVVYKPEVSTSTYKALKEVNPDAAKVFEQALIIKPGSGTLELIVPKAKA